MPEAMQMYHCPYRCGYSGETQGDIDDHVASMELVEDGVHRDSPEVQVLRQAFNAGWSAATYNEQKNGIVHDEDRDAAWRKFRDG